MLLQEIAVANTYPLHLVLVRIPDKINITFLLQTLNLAMNDSVQLVVIRNGGMRDARDSRITHKQLPDCCIVFQPASESDFKYEQSLPWNGCYEITPTRQAAHYQITCYKSEVVRPGETAPIGGLLNEIAEGGGGTIFVETPEDADFKEKGDIFERVAKLFGRENRRYVNIHAETADSHIAKIIENKNKHNSICFERGVGDKLRALGNIGYFATSNIIVGPTTPSLTFSASIALKVERVEHGYIASVLRVPVWCNLASTRYKFTL